MTTATATASIVADRLDSLHTLGTDVSGAPSTMDALEQAGLTGWNVRTEQSYTADGRKIPGGRYSAATIDGQERIFGQVGSSYTPVQTESFAGLLDTIAGESGAQLDTVLTTNGGSRVLVAMKMPEMLKVGGIDPLNINLLALINHKTGSNRLSAVPFRVFCANQQPQIIRDGDELFTLRHTSGASARMDQAGEMLESVGSHLVDFQATAEQMLNAQMSTEEFLSITNKLFPRTGKAQIGETRHTNRQERFRHLFAEAETQEPIRWTRWAGYQAVVEWIDHEQGTRTPSGEGASMPSTPAQRRALRALTGGSAADKLKALNAFSVSSN